MGRVALGLLLWLAAWPVLADGIYNPGSSSGGSSTITANSTATQGFAANTLVSSDGTHVQPIAPCAGGVLSYSAGSVPSCSTTLPAGIAISSGSITTGLGYTPLNPSLNLSDVNSASTALSNLSGAPKASPAFTGQITIPVGTHAAPGMVGGTANQGWFTSSGNWFLNVGGTSTTHDFQLGASTLSSLIPIGSNPVNSFLGVDAVLMDYATGDVAISRVISHRLAVSATNLLPSAIDVYNSFTASSGTTNYDKAIFDMGLTTANVLTIGTLNGGTFTTARAINIAPGGANAITLSGAQLIAFPAITSDVAHTDASVCEDTTSHALYSGSGTLGVCLGTSGRQFKTGFSDMRAGLDEVMALKLWNYHYIEGYGDNGKRMQYGPTAQDVEQVLPDLVGHDASGVAINYDIGAFIPIALHAIQQLKIEFSAYRDAHP